MEKNMEILLKIKKKKSYLPYDPAIPLLAIYPEKTFEKIYAPQCS